jgi:anti-sigma B factor antagonist
MSFETREVGGAMVVEVTGELDVANATGLAEHLNGVFKKFPKKVILDLDGVGYMASSGLAMLVSALRKSREMRVVFGICGLSPIVRQSVEVTALHEILPIYSDVNDALRRMN